MSSTDHTAFREAASYQAPPLQAFSLHPVWLSARTPAALAKMTENLARHLRKKKHLRLQDISFTLLAGREHFSHRRALLCGSLDDAIIQLSDQENLPHHHAKGRKTGLQLVFPNADAKTLRGVGDLYQKLPHFRIAMDELTGLLKGLLPLSPLQALIENPRYKGKDALDHAAIARPLGVAVQLALFQSFQALGYRTPELVGLGMGEWAAAAASGWISAKEALQLAHLLGASEDETSSQEALQQALNQLRPQIGTIPLVSGHQGTLLTEPIAQQASFWLNAAQRTGHNPGPILHKPGCETLVLGSPGDLPASTSNDVAYLAVLPSDGAEMCRYLWQVIGKLYMHGVSPDWKQMFKDADVRRAPLPAYPFENRRYWFKPGPQEVVHEQVAQMAPPPAPPSPPPEPKVTGEKAPGDLTSLIAQMDEKQLDQLLARYEVAPPAASPPRQPPVSPSPVESAHERPELDTEYVAPRSAIEAELGSICARLLKIDKVGMDDNIMNLGADSMFTMQLSRELEERYNVTVTPHHLFAQPTIASLAETIQKERS